ncbi:MAG TPA: 4Fe-4S binding protein [Methylomirabilota bacterium]|nr:4Fe-4S binding protein [Methylomirabilota bacterium]
MRIDQAKCVGCGNCVAVCPMGAISVDVYSHRASVNEDECVECYTCWRGMSRERLNPSAVRTIRAVARALRFRFEPEPDVCPTGALAEGSMAFPRNVRRAFSDPVVPHESTGIGGRGTEEVKTNDVTGRVGPGEAGFTIEFGRPGIGVRFRDIDRVTRGLSAIGVDFEKDNPVTSLMPDTKTGHIRDDVLNEKIMSAIVEVKTRIDRVPELLRVLRTLTAQIETVMCLGVSARCDERGGTELEDVLRAEGFPFWRGKTNLGLGRPLWRATA